MDMVESVAEALHKANDAQVHVKFRVSWEDCLPAYREMIRVDAIAAIEALREPSRDVLTAFVDDAVSVQDTAVRWACVSLVLLRMESIISR